MSESRNRFRLWEPRIKREEHESKNDSGSENLAETNAYGYVTGLGAFVVPTGNRCTGSPYSFEEISSMAADPMHHIKQLREWSRWAYHSDGTVTTAVDSLKTLHSLDYVVVAKPKKASVQREGGYRSNASRMDGALRSMRYKEVIRNALHHDAVDGMYVGYMETKRTAVSGEDAFTDAEIEGITEVNATGVTVTVKDLPIEYVRIIGRRDSCYEAAFDLRFFDGIRDAEDRKRILSGYPKEIQKGWQVYERDGRSAQKNWLRLNWRKTIVTKIKSRQSDPYGVPFAVAALDDIDYARYFTQSKRHVLDSVNNQIYYETFPEGKEKGTSSLTSKQQESQHNTVRDALNKRTKSGRSFFSLAAGTEMGSLPVDISLLDEQNENGIKEDVNEDIGFSAAALNGRSSGNYATANLNIEIISNNVFSWIEDIVNELNKCLNYNVIRDKNFKIEFRVLPVTFTNREKYVKFYADLYARGKGSLMAWIAAAGINPDDYISLMDYELEEDFENRYPVHKTSFTVTGKDAPDTDVDGSQSSNPSTQSTEDNGGNQAPSASGK